ncbi:hypothetical protein A2V49_03020 [candidate division WWE3 bacterium RBG_19FT_COMBO_34_6]|uniref:Uncharacterized protein n=1 Tax=candidate division WWE3 bacterium RBG_19FT_COMBO_34_6 TaxID=1802612 RepID=A0A1F4UL06_UNCKA|nr:MAG: hypothetical protein A2V49_03020 [candidate division WWE3 bacterium RBG_19FT_COMBO_34_6]
MLFSFIFGAILSFFTKDFYFDIPYLKEGMGVGLVFGILWSLVKYKSNGIEGIESARKDFGKSIIYFFSFTTGFFIFFGLRKFILFLIY